jgi:hypothetical protein
MTNPRPRVIMHWETVGVSALPPGWRNTFRQGDGELTASPCPALLLQEHRGDTRAWDEPAGDHWQVQTRDEPLDPPYETRVVFADFDPGMAELVSADDAGNYAGTIAPGEETGQ